MEQKITCFDFQNHSSDFLDGTLANEVRPKIQAHIHDCADCQKRIEHLKVILSTLAEQPRSVIPAAIRKDPLAPVVSKTEAARLKLSRWERVPWYIRTTIEGIGIVLVILGGISSGPRLRSLYESKIERSLAEFRDGLSVHQADETASVADVPPLEEKVIATAEERQDELAGEDEDHPDSHLKVGKSELWRFEIKTVSPDELRPQVVKALTELGIPANTPGLGGTQVPGGIEFELLLTKPPIDKITAALRSLAPRAPEEQKNSSSFAWYTVTSKREIPNGKSLVVIWLSQPH